MPELRLHGAPLRIARKLSSNGAFRSLLWAASAKDFGVDRLRALPASARAALDDQERPIAGRAPHGWTTSDLPTPTPKRATYATLHRAFVEGRTTPSALLEAWLARVGAGDFGDATHSPFVTLDVERARRAAADATARFAAGRPKGPLDGVVVPVKDEVDMVGLPTIGGTSYRREPATADGFWIRKLRDAGAVVVAKTHATEWGMNPWGGNAHHAFPRNAWSAGHGAGGSSTGSGVAVALGYAPAAVGSDGGGSIRIPASLNGVFGLKPTYVRVGRTGDVWQAGTTMSHVGPLAGTVADAVELLLALTGLDPDDAATTFAPDGHDVAHAWRAALHRGVRGATIGVLRGEWADADPRVAAAGMLALSELEKDGAILVDVDVPFADMAPAVGALTIASEAAANQADDLAAHGAAYGDELALIFSLMQGLGAQELLACYRVRAQLRRSVAACFRDRVDLLALPTTARTAPPYPLSRVGDTMAPGDTAAMTRFAFLGNLTGVPAGTVPCGLVDGLPAGLQLVGDAWDEASVIAAMAQAERVGFTDLGRPKGFFDPSGA